MRSGTIFLSQLMLFFLFANNLFAGSEAMPSMPILKVKRVFTVQGNENLEAQMGFGNEEPMVRMMNLMMVEGSGMEGMDMSGMEMGMSPDSTHEMNGHRKGLAQGPQNSARTSYEILLTKQMESVKVGKSLVEFSVRSIEMKNPVNNLKIKAKVYMTSMDMGTEEPKVKEISPGIYQVIAPFTMKGPWAVKIILPNNEEKVFNFDVK